VTAVPTNLTAISDVPAKAVIIRRIHRSTSSDPAVIIRRKPRSPCVGIHKVANIGTRVMTGHGMIGMAEECFAIFGGDTRRSQTARERVPKIMDANQRQSDVASGVLPTAVVHGVDTPPAKWEDPDRMQRSLCFDNRPGDII
jgi:hypothetical protein